MELTFIGVIQLLIGLAIVLAGSLRQAFAFLLFSGLFGGGAAIALPALGGSSIPPIHFACLFVYLRILAPRGGFAGMLPAAVHANRWLVVYTLYGIASAVIAPRLFAGQIDVFPMRGDHLAGLFSKTPLGPTPQNITASIYLLGTLVIAIAAYIVCSFRGGVAAIISGVIAVGWLDIMLAVVTTAAADTPLKAFFDLFRNGGYAQLEQAHGGFPRITGFFPEASTFATFSFAYFVVNAELWYRSVRPLATGSLALALAITLFVSTSSTAYLGLGAYLAFFTLRLLAMPDLAQGGRARELALALLGIMVLAACLFLAAPTLLTGISEMVRDMTWGKSASSSAQQRLFWAMQGWDAFRASYGLGTGPGSFRSSSLVMAIIGCMGVIGLVSFVAYAVQVFQPARRSSYAPAADPGHTVGGAFAAAAMIVLVPLSVSSPSVDFGANFAFFAGAALALRPAARRRNAPAMQASHSAQTAPFSISPGG